MARPRGQRAHQALLPRTSPLRPPMLLASIAVLAAAVAGARCSGVVKLSNPEGQISDGSATTDYSKRPFVAQGLVQGRGSTPCNGTEAGVGCEQSDGWKFFRHGKGAIDALGYTNTYSYDLCAAHPEMCYASDMYCAWEINVPGPARIELTVEAYHIEPQLDTFRIYEGVPLYEEANGAVTVTYAHTASMEDLSCVGCDAWDLETMGPSFRPAGIGTTSGSIIGAGFERAPRKIVVNSHAAFLYFHSDSSGVYSGFVLSYRTLPVLCKPGFWIPIVNRVGKKYSWSSTVRTMGNDCYPCSSSCGDAFSCPLGSSASSPSVAWTQGRVQTSSTARRALFVWVTPKPAALRASTSPRRAPLPLSPARPARTASAASSRAREKKAGLARRRPGVNRARLTTRHSPSAGTALAASGT